MLLLLLLLLRSSVHGSPSSDFLPRSNSLPVEVESAATLETVYSPRCPPLEPSPQTRNCSRSNYICTHFLIYDTLVHTWNKWSSDFKHDTRQAGMKVHTYTCGYEIISSKHLVGQCVINRRHNKTVQARRRERERHTERERERERERDVHSADRSGRDLGSLERLESHSSLFITFYLSCITFL